MTDRPVWPHKNISEEDARFFSRHAILQVTYGWEYTSADTTNDWFDLWENDPKNTGSFVAFGSNLRMIRRIDKIPDIIAFNKLPMGNKGLFTLPDWIARDVQAIDRWDAAHALEIAEFERLKVKLGR